jgi:hypothetical protein
VNRLTRIGLAAGTIACVAAFFIRIALSLLFGYLSYSLEVLLSPISISVAIVSYVGLGAFYGGYYARGQNMPRTRQFASRRKWIAIVDVFVVAIMVLVLVEIQVLRGRPAVTGVTPFLPALSLILFFHLIFNGWKRLQRSPQ